MTQRPYNFNAGPAMLPESVLAEAKEGLVDYRGSGRGVLEMGHREDDFLEIAHAAEADLRDLINIPDNYKVLFLHGGARGQFAAVPMNLATRNDTADYVVNGSWGKAAAAEGKKFLADAHIAAESTPYTYVPDESEWRHSARPAYVHITDNETIDGVAFDHIPETEAPLVADKSSDILSEPIEVSKYAVIYFGTQKNSGPAGMAGVIVREDMLGATRPDTPAILDWTAEAEQGSMVNTPPTATWYIAGLVFKWLKNQGGVEAMAEINKHEAEKLYRAIDESELYMNPVRRENRSHMNVPFTITVPGLDKIFLLEARTQGLINLKGHRSVGGMRASLYNAMPESGVDALVEFMKAFEEKPF